MEMAESMSTRSLRIAFLTVEFVTEQGHYGGLASYLARMVRVVKASGHEPEVFVLSRATPRVVDFEGVRVQRVHTEDPWWLRQFGRVTRKLFGREPHGLVPKLGVLIPHIRCARSLSRALEERHRQAPFDFVQSADYRAPGLFVKKRPDRPHLIRCSGARDLFNSVDRVDKIERAMNPILREGLQYLELRSIRRATKAYAPSKLVADHYKNKYKLPVHVVRPPFILNNTNAEERLPNLPSRYLLHFGHFGRRKGSDVVANALVEAWEEQPDLVMVWAGNERRKGLFQEYARKWGEKASAVTWLGPVARPVIVHLIKNAEACVLPSRVDNLPNTVLETLALGVPVIGSRGASIDEIVEEGVTGLLVPIGDSSALAHEMVRIWRGEVEWKNSERRSSGLLEEMEPSKAVQSLLRFAGFDTKSAALKPGTKRNHLDHTPAGPKMETDYME